MKGLLIKDISVLIKKSKAVFLMIFIFGAMPATSFTGLSIMYPSMLPITGIAYDEQSKWDSLAAMMPYSVFELAFSKYVLCYIITLVSAAVTSIIHNTVALFVSYAAPVTALELVVYLCVSLLITAINIPLVLRFGVEKGRFAFIFITIGISLFCVNNIDTLTGIFSSLDSGSVTFLPLFIAAALLLNALSVPLSMLCYAKRYR